MDVAVGLDVAKEFHWAVATRLDPQSGKAVPVLSRRVDNLPGDIAALIEELMLLFLSSCLLGDFS
ncbi:MAG: IS110 family transposase [Actinomycetota bacterium]|nr:IS110 family transposase [Actinomycetota bacterium]